MTGLDIHSQWARIGAGFTTAPSEQKVDLESLIVRSVEQAPADARLFWVVASWLARHYKLVDTRRVGRFLDDLARMHSAVAGALLDVALTQAPEAKALRAARAHCRALGKPRVLFDVVSRHAVLARIARKESLPLFARWGLHHHEITWKLDAIRPVQWIVSHCPEFRLRMLVGADLEAAVLQSLLALPATISDLARTLDVTRAAVHEAVANLAGRGWVHKPRSGYRKHLTVPSQLVKWLAEFPSLVGDG